MFNLSMFYLSRSALDSATGDSATSARQHHGLVRGARPDGAVRVRGGGGAPLDGAGPAADRGEAGTKIRQYQTAVPNSRAGLPLLPALLLLLPVVLDHHVGNGFRLLHVRVIVRPQPVRRAEVREPPPVVVDLVPARALPAPHPGAP